MNFSKKTVMITGAVRNTGLAIAKEFAAAGANIILNGRKDSDVKRVADALRKDYGVEVLEACADIAVEKEVDRVFDSLEKQNIKLDVLVNNAVVQAVGYSFVDTPLDVLENAFKINVFGLFHCAQRAAKMMIAQGGGSIVNIGSNTAIRPVKKRTAYVATKGAAASLTRAMAIDLAEYNIRVNMVIAGYINSDRWPKLAKEDIERRHKNIPLGHECMGKDIARGVLFMASDESPRTTGSSILIDGGCTTQLVPTDCDV